MSLAIPTVATPRAQVVLRRLASLRLTVVLIVALAIGVALAFDQDLPATWSLAAPLAGLAVNLAAAVATHPTFRRQLPLLVFHLALIAVVLLAAIGRLTYLQGRVELSQGEVFNGVLLAQEAGPLHPGDLAAAAFTHDGYTIDYAPQMRRGATRNAVRWRDADGQEHRAQIGDDTPLVLQGYRFYTSPNKGFAAVVTWWPDDDFPKRGTIHFPSFPVFEFDQRIDWTPLGSANALTLRLELPRLVDDQRAWQLALPATSALRVQMTGGGTDGTGAALAPGQTLALPGGRLRYDGLSSWMGYTVRYDPTLPWLLAASLLAVLAMALHLWRRHFAQPWRP